MTIAILAMQGAFLEHGQMLDRLGVEHFEIRIIFFESRPDFAVVGANLRLIVDISRCSKRIGDFIDGNAADVNFPVFDFHEKTPSLLFYSILARERWKSKAFLQEIPFFF